MGQARAHRPIALVVEDDASQRVLVTTLLEESEMSVIQCESAEAAELVMSKIGRAVSLLFTDVKLAGNMTGLELADKAKARYPEMTVIITLKPRFSCASRAFSSAVKASSRCRYTSRFSVARPPSVPDSRYSVQPPSRSCSSARRQ